MNVRKIRSTDAAAWLRLRCALWAESAESEHAAEIAAFLEGQAREPFIVLVVGEEGGEPVGFFELSIRRYAEGCCTLRVAYLEGWYVESSARNAGWAVP